MSTAQTKTTRSGHSETLLPDGARVVATADGDFLAFPAVCIVRWCCFSLAFRRFFLLHAVYPPQHDRETAQCSDARVLLTKNQTDQTVWTADGSIVHLLPCVCFGVAWQPSLE
jgi:hypothetical protein